MASISSELRLNSAHSRLLYSARLFSSLSILNPDAAAPLSSKQKSRAALSLLKSEKNPERILDICRAASLTPDSHLDRIAFSVAISKLTESKYFEGIRLFIEELKMRPDLQNERFISHAIVLYGQAGLLDHAFQTFDKMSQMGVRQSAKSLNALIFACIVAKKYDEVNRVFVDFPRKYGVKPNLDTYNSVIKAFSESGSTSAAYSVLAEMEREGCQPNHTTYGNLLAGFHREEKLEDVERVLKMMNNRGMKVGISTYNIRIQSLCKLKKSSEAKGLFERLLSRGIKPNSVTFCHLIHGFGREGNLEEAKNFFKDMRKRGFKPDSDCYFLLVSFLCQGGDFEAAFEVCKECMAKGWVPSFTTMKSLVNGLAGISKVEEARQIISEIKETFPKNNDLWNEIEEGLPK